MKGEKICNTTPSAVLYWNLLFFFTLVTPSFAGESKPNERSFQFPEIATFESYADYPKARELIHAEPSAFLAILSDLVSTPEKVNANYKLLMSLMPLVEGDIPSTLFASGDELRKQANLSRRMVILHYLATAHHHISPGPEKDKMAGYWLEFTRHVILHPIPDLPSKTVLKELQLALFGDPAYTYWPAHGGDEFVTLLGECLSLEDVEVRRSSMGSLLYLAISKRLSFDEAIFFLNTQYDIERTLGARGLDTLHKSELSEWKARLELAHSYVPIPDESDFVAIGQSSDAELLVVMLDESSGRRRLAFEELLERSEVSETTARLLVDFATGCAFGDCIVSKLVQSDAPTNFPDIVSDLIAYIEKREDQPPDSALCPWQGTPLVPGWQIRCAERLLGIAGDMPDDEARSAFRIILRRLETAITAQDVSEMEYYSAVVYRVLETRPALCPESRHMLGEVGATVEDIDDAELTLAGPSMIKKMILWQLDRIHKLCD